MKHPSPKEKFLRTAAEKGYVTLDGLLLLIDDYASRRPASASGCLAAVSSRCGENNLDSPPGHTAN